MRLGGGLRLAIVIVAGFVLYRLAPVIAHEWQGQDACPDLGALPACYLVGLGYAAMGIAALVAPSRLSGLFLAGRIPVFLLAATGSMRELFGRPTCPLSPVGVPMCYLSLSLACLLLPAFMASMRLQRKTT